MLKHSLFCVALLFASSLISPALAADYVDDITGMEFMAIPGGIFVMGDDNVVFASPEHEVTVQPFLLGRYEVTFEQYAKFCSSTGRLIPEESVDERKVHPVTNITWQDAVDFTEWLSEKTGRTFRLPSEAEWEFAARGGASTTYPWGDEIGENNANCRGCGSKWDDRTTAPVGSFAPNGYGLYDMIGNVYEWNLDTRHDDYEGAPRDGSAWVEDGVSDNIGRESHMYRGGSWSQPIQEMTIVRRCWDWVEQRSDELGFRVLLEP